MPRIVISDTIRNVKRNERKLHFNKELLDAIAERLARNEQVILFQNRRGYTPYLECPQCGYSARCPHCNVSLSVHQQRNRAVCHYCGYNEPITSHCPNCRTVEMKPMGFGTERVEEALQGLFPEARILRLDGDTATSNSAYSRIIGAFARKEADILVGTQIVAKGLDFGNVTLIGILNGDNLLAAPDFRAEERALQLLLQVAGRCGRREEQGEVIIQSADPQHRVYSFINNYEAGLNAMLAERQRYSYPPYVRLLRITLRDNDVKRLVEVATLFGDALRRRFGRRVLGPVSPLIDRIRREHRIEILLKIENSASFAKARAIVREEITALRTQPSAKRTTIICDVDLC
jgi:primosomal protein N' (replication factor Y)